jgi:DNA gyrase/topoisomerase IV subunit A
VPVYKLADKSVNLKESGMLKLGSGEVIKHVVSVREDFLTDENKQEKYLVIGTKKGKIKRLPLEKIGRVMKGGKKVINIAKHNDDISQIVFTSGADSIMVFTRQGKNKNFSEEKIRIVGRAAYGDTAIKLEVNEQKVRCSRHKNLLEEHKIAACCDKSQLGASLRCPRGKEINQELRSCSECNKTIPISPDQVSDEMISLLLVKKDLAKNELGLLAIREDKMGIKKNFSSVFELGKKRGGKGKRKFRIEEKEISKYCGKHENSINKLKGS